MLIDDVTITLKAGNGGNGSVHFKRNAMTAKGGPDGGNGGKGADIYVQGVDDMLGLREFQYKKEIKAESGVGGGRQNLYGRNGKDLVIHMPLGSLITDTTTGETWEITNTTDRILLAVGGNGGRGNNEFKTATNQTPTFAEPGDPGQERIIHIKLRLIADIGFIGLPNAGKSSLLHVLTNAHPKIGDYPFTTLEPNLGVLTAETEEKIILADIPGLIAGASTGKGLGIQFLRHVEKTNALIHCIDSTDAHPLETYHIVRKEIENFSAALAQKPEIILLTKTDLASSEDVMQRKEALQVTKKDIYVVSIYNEKNINELKKLLITISNKK